MKKIFVLTLVVFVLFSCEISPRKTNADIVNISCPNVGCVTYERRTYDGFEWAIFSSTERYGMAPFVINLTKERLEIEKLKLEIKYYKNSNNNFY